MNQSQLEAGMNLITPSSIIHLCLHHSEHLDHPGITRAHSNGQSQNSTMKQISFNLVYDVGDEEYTMMWLVLLLSA